MNIAQTIATPQHYAANRTFGAAPMVKERKKPVDPDGLKVCNDPIPTHRKSPGNKYEGLFSGLGIGYCVKCKPSEVGTVSAALRKWIVDKELDAKVQSTKDYGDGKGRVWLVAA